MKRLICLQLYIGRMLLSCTSTAHRFVPVHTELKKGSGEGCDLGLMLVSDTLEMLKREGPVTTAA
jgi:hypothetical protein